jgi:hypothetical protein
LLVEFLEGHELEGTAGGWAGAQEELRGVAFASPTIRKEGREEGRREASKVGKYGRRESLPPTTTKRGGPIYPSNIYGTNYIPYFPLLPFPPSTFTHFSCISTSVSYCKPPKPTEKALDTVATNGYIKDDWEGRAIVLRSARDGLCARHS